MYGFASNTFFAHLRHTPNVISLIVSMSCLLQKDCTYISMNTSYVQTERRRQILDSVPMNI